MKKTTRLLSCILALLTALPVTGLLTSCSDDSKDKNKRVAEPVAVDHVWKAEYIPFPEKIGGGWDRTVSDGVVTFIGDRMIFKEPYEVEPVLVTFDLTEKTFSYDPLPEVDSDGYIASFLPKPDGGHVILKSIYDEATQSQTFLLTSTAPDGSTLFSLDAKAQFQQINEENAQWFYVNETQMDKDGNLYLIADQNVAVLSPEGKRLYEVAFTNHIQQSGVTADGDVYISYWDRSGDTFGQVYKLLDNEKKDVGEALPMPACIPTENVELHMAPGYDIYYTDDTGLFAANNEDAEPSLLCSWINSDLTPDQVSNVTVLSDQQILFNTYDPVSDTPQFCILTPVAPEDVVPKYLIHVAAARNGGWELPQYAVAFNRESDKYRVVLDYYDGIYTNEVEKTPMDLLKEDIVNGKTPDVIISDNFGDSLYYNELENLGILSDLYPYLDSYEDPDFTRSAFFPCVLAPFETSKGELHGLISSFQMTTFAAKQDYTGPTFTWRPSDMLALAKSLTEDQYLFTYWTPPADMPNAPTPQMQILGTLLPTALSSFVNEELATCTFDDPEFAALLEICKLCPAVERDESLVKSEELQNDRMMLFQANFSGFDEYLRTRYYMFRDSDYIFVGYPTTDETHHSGTAIIPNQIYSITKDSPVADGAWKFIKRCFGTTDERYYRHDGFQSLRTAFDKQFENGLTMVYTFQENGWGGSGVGSVEDMPEAIKEAEENKQPGEVVGYLKPENKDFFLALFDTVTMTPMKDPKLEEMIKEEASAYFAGAKTLEETVKVIQSRASIYISENNG